MYVLIPAYERPDLPLRPKSSRDLSKLPVGPMNLDWIGFTPAGYQPHPVRKQLPRDVAERLLKDWVTGQREPMYTTPASPAERTLENADKNKAEGE